MILTTDIYGDLEKVFELIVEIVDDVFNNKSTSWHYFYEGEFISFRFSEDYRSEVLSILKNSDVVNEYTKFAIWEDTSWFVRRHPTEYARIFNANSRIAIEEWKSNKEDIREKSKKVGGAFYMMQGHADRIIHSFYNMNTQNADFPKSLIDARGLNNREEEWEMYAMSLLLADRSWWCGYRAYFLKNVRPYIGSSEDIEK